ncbi:MAG: hypothetical protein AMR96_03985 [Candidatus Adiutrix intracellularis]|nr:MAG: hypothetical protein AMR96_03985 [Candidatus Adiutrix intracellularis]
MGRKVIIQKDRGGSLIFASCLPNYDEAVFYLQSYFLFLSFEVIISWAGVELYFGQMRQWWFLKIGKIFYFPVGMLFSRAISIMFL